QRLRLQPFRHCREWHAGPGQPGACLVPVPRVRQRQDHALAGSNRGAKRRVADHLRSADDIGAIHRRQLEDFAPVAKVRAHSLTGESLQLEPRCIRYDAREIRLQSLDVRPVAEPHRAGDRVELPTSEPLRHAADNGPAGGVRRIDRLVSQCRAVVAHAEFTASGAGSDAGRDCRRTSTIRWITVIVVAPARPHSAIARSTGTSKMPENPVSARITINRSERSAMPTLQVMPRLSARAFAYDVTTPATRS